MSKYIKVMLSVLLMSLCVMNMLPIQSVSARETYKIPKYENFRPSKAADDIERTVNKNSVIETVAEDNKIVVDGEAVLKKHNEAKSEIDGYIKRLNNNGMYLNRELSDTVTVNVKNINISEYVNIVIDSENISKITEIDNLKFVLDKNNECIMLNNESIKNIAESHKSFNVQFKRLSDIYSLRFLDKEGNIIYKYNVDIKVSLPAKHSEQTVYLFMDNNQENWGGQYNGINGSIEFMTKYSGEYNVASPEIVINDIESLSESEKQAIRFMTVRGYFEVENQKFKPESKLTRYDFAKSLVGMFFALDKDARCTFSDVNKRNYKYIAASQQSNIVQGFDDGTFRGNENVTVEQVMAITARTINQKNGYVYPENIDKYLRFTDDEAIGKWAEKEAALAIREGIYSYDMKLNPSEEISRKDAAVMLYRLFMIMNNTPDPTDLINEDLNYQSGHESVWNEQNAIIVCFAVIAMDVIVLAVSVLFIKKKEKDDELDKG